MPTWCDNVIYWSFLSSTCFGYIRPSSGALDVELERMVFCTEFVDGWWSWEPLRRMCVRFGWCRVPTAPYTRPTQWLSSTCFGYIRPSSGALDVELERMVFCTQFVDGWWCMAPSKPYIRPTQWLSGPPPSYKNWVQKTMCCNLTCNAPDDGRMRPKHVELRKLQ